MFIRRSSVSLFTVSEETLAPRGSAGPDRGPAAPPLPPLPLSTVGRAFAVVLAGLGAGHVLFLLVPSVQLLDVLDLSREQSLGTWVASSLHLACASLSAVGAVAAGRAHSRWAGNWWLLAAAFLVMSVDETAAVHDRLVQPLQTAFDTSGALLYPWVVVAGLLGLVFLLAQLRFIRHLGRPTGRDLVIAGIVFVAGAAGVEMLEGVVASSAGLGRDSLVYDLLVLLEEMCELGAVMWVVVILGRHLSASGGTNHPSGAGTAGAVA